MILKFSARQFFDLDLRRDIANLVSGMYVYMHNGNYNNNGNNDNDGNNNDTDGIDTDDIDANDNDADDIDADDNDADDIDADDNDADDIDADDMDPDDIDADDNYLWWQFRGVAYSVPPYFNMGVFRNVDLESNHMQHDV